MSRWKLRAVAIVAAAALAISGCSSNKTSDNGGNVAASQELRIGTRFAPTDTFDPSEATSAGAMILLFSVYDSLVLMTADGPVMSLAESVEPNDTSDEWTVTLRKGLTFSDGTAVTGQDVLDSLAHLAQSPTLAALYSNIDFEASSVQGNVVVLKTKTPVADFVESILGMMSTVSPGGRFDGVGAGPYIVEKGDPTTGYTLQANAKYWKGKPKIPSIVLVPVPESSSQAAALISGEIDYAAGLDASSVATLAQHDEIVVPEPTLDSAVAMDFVLNTRVAPFNDPEVRKAFRLTLDREKMVNTLLGKTGEIGNDLLGKGYPGYPDMIQQTVADKEEARRIFAEHGVTSFEIAASDTVPGSVAAAELAVQEFKEVGVDVTIDKKDPETYLSDMDTLYTKQAFTFYWVNRSPLSEFRNQIAPDSYFNVSGYTSETLRSAYEAAVSTTDEAKRNEIVARISQELHDSGGEVIWGYQMQITAYRSGLKGVVLFQSIPWLVDASYEPAA